MKLFTLTDNGVLAGVEIIIGHKEEVGGIPLAPQLLKKIKDKIQKEIDDGAEGTLEGSRYLLGACDLEYNPQNEVEYIIEEEWIDRRSILLVDLTPGVDGRIEFRADVHQEVLDPKAGVVEREQLPLSMATGVTMLAEVEGSFPTTLLRMTPGARFRLRRTGDLRDNQGNVCLPVEVHVGWDGWWSPKVVGEDPIAPPKSQNAKQFGMYVN